MHLCVRAAQHYMWHYTMDINENRTQTELAVYFLSSLTSFWCGAQAKDRMTIRLNGKLLQG